jgi:hypothetical protein|tara:strand:+ start:88 stop:525 length:438 start_codon:yes stop_codon:yes gene_type:complete
MSKTSKNVQKFLKDGENIVANLKGNSYTNSSNPIVRMVMAVVRIIMLIMGSPTRTSVVCTDKRLILETTQKVLWIFDYSSTITAVAPRGVMQVGYSFQRSWLIFKNHYLTLVLAGTPQEVVLSKDGYNGVMEMLSASESLREKVN